MYLLSLVFFLQPPKPNHPVGSASSRLPWLAAPPPPSIPTHVLLFFGDVSPNTHPHLNQSTLVLPSACYYTATSSTAPVRSHPRSRRRSLSWLARCARRRLALSTWSTTKRNQEMTVRGEADSRDPPRSLHFASRCLVITSQKILPPNCLTTRSHAIVNVVNKRENYTTSG